MNALFSHLEGRERRTLVRLALAVLLAALLFFVLAVRQRSRYFEAKDSLAVLQETARKAERSDAATKAEWLRWQEAGRDLDSFRGKTFYEETNVFQSLRRDLQQIFAQAAMDVADIGYRYSDFEKVPIKKVVVTFSYSGRYADLERFLAIIERFPKFLAVEKIEFQKTNADNGLLNLRLTLAGYYET
jgi:Tfp pilus assembly protein PilO